VVSPAEGQLPRFYGGDYDGRKAQQAVVQALAAWQFRRIRIRRIGAPTIPAGYQTIPWRHQEQWQVNRWQRNTPRLLVPHPPRVRQFFPVSRMLEVTVCNGLGQAG